MQDVQVLNKTKHDILKAEYLEPTNMSIRLARKCIEKENSKLSYHNWPQEKSYIAKKYVFLKIVLRYVE